MDVYVMECGGLSEYFARLDRQRIYADKTIFASSCPFWQEQSLQALFFPSQVFLPSSSGKSPPVMATVHTGPTYPHTRKRVLVSRKIK